MDKSLFRTNDYCLFTFGSTSHALKAEAHLKRIGANFITIPTLREISASCGLSIKMYCDNREAYYCSIKENNILVDGVYHVTKRGNKLELQKIEGK
ncbi:MAG TPA: hypothetical protein DER33_04265 [Syntrophomonas sp.]|nr:hypothetical protein [Syntrophomonas sp.]HCF70796.1 hypothetical protein [Syntrophomonas sp.]